MSSDLKHTPLYALHVGLGARMVPFAGYAMPVQYDAGIIAEHRHTRSAASLFDVSHMGQAVLTARGDAASALERLVPGDLSSLQPGQMRYTLLLNDDGGIIDDLIVTRPPDGATDRLLMVVNAARKDVDFDDIRRRLEGAAELAPADDKALLALQGPAAADVMERLAPDVAALPFMHAAECSFDRCACTVSRSGYTGEDGFELSVPAEKAEAVARTLLDHPEVAPAGLGARDSLRLEAGLCLYGQDIDETTTPVEAGLAWTIAKRRRAEGGFSGAATVLRQLADGPSRRRVGLALDGRTPARAGAEIVAPDGTPIGHVTSGGYAPSLERPIAMGYVDRSHAAAGTEVHLLVRGRSLPATVAKMPFVAPNYYRGGT